MDSFEPLRVTAMLRTGVVADRWLPLDGILLYQAYRDALGPQAMTTPGGGELPDVDMPLVIVHPGEPTWYYACSWAQPQPWWIAEGTDHWNKRLDVGFAELIDFGKKRGVVLVEKGEYKAYHMPVHYYVASRIEWFCVGNRAAIERLLATVTHVGKKQAQGWGRVAAWTVEPWPADWSVWRGDELMRGVPFDDARGLVDLALYGLRPPYWRRDNQMMVVLP